MSVTVNFGSFTKKRNSTKQPTNELTDVRTVAFKESTSVDSPTFILTGNAFDYNYASWNDGTITRYYFISDIRTMKNNLTEIDCILDVLATYRTEILASTQYVSYSAIKTSDWLADLRIPVQKNTTISSKTSTQAFLSTIGCYILTVVGEKSCNTYMIQSEGVLQNILEDIATWESTEFLRAIGRINTSTPTNTQGTAVTPVDGSYFECFKALIATIQSVMYQLGQTAVSVQNSVNTLMSSIEKCAADTGLVGNAYANAPQCIRSCIWVPFDYVFAPASGNSGAIKLGKYDTGETGVAIKATPVTGSFELDIPWQYTDWRRSVCEDIYLYMPLVGMIQLSGDSLTHAGKIQIDWSITYTDGAVCYKVSAGNEVIGSYGGQCSSNYPLGVAQQASAGEVMNTLIAGADKSISGLVQSTVSPVSAGAAIGSFALNALATGYQVENTKKSTHISCVGGVGGGAGIGLGKDFVIYSVAHPTVISPDDMQATMGLPTMAPVQLSDIDSAGGGYCECANAHVECAAMASELDAIDSFLNSGFYIE